MNDAEKQWYHPRTLCELCAKAYGFCPWSKKGDMRPVEGWDAIRNDLFTVSKKYDRRMDVSEESYVVLDCPLFELEPQHAWAYEKFDREKIREGIRNQYATQRRKRR